ncbi:MAG TPA: NAD-dependent epimerase/dehydratase family protein [Opitutales bacterium]|nr:NAD-dependent epimerase/dehydratase family protein [Opitutales bacterium]
MKKVLFIGGTGIISSACSRLALERGIELWHLNRGRTGAEVGVRACPGVKEIHADIRNFTEARAALKGMEFDAVVDWISFVPEHLATCLELFHGRVGQFVFISSASAYETPPSSLPVTEKTPLSNPFWEYSRSKIACEKFLERAWTRESFPYTVVRPSHTYDATCIIMEGGYTNIARMKEGKPVVVHGDGTSLWTLTHHKDFAVGLVGLLCNPKAIAKAIHITSDEWLSWNQIFEITGRAFGYEPKIVHIPSDVIAKYDEGMGASLLGDKAHSMIFDNSLVKSLVPDYGCKITYAEGVKEIAAWYAQNPNAGKADPRLDAVFDKILADYPKAWR